MSIERIDEEESAAAEAVKSAETSVAEQKTATEKNDEKHEKTIKDVFQSNQQHLVKQITTKTGIDTSAGFAENMKNISCQMIARNAEGGTPMYNPAQMLSQLKCIIEPFKTAMSTLQQAVGNIPGLSEVSQMFGMLTSGVASSPPPDPTTQQPELTLDIYKNLQKTKDNVMTFCSQLPMMFINLLFAMVEKLFQLIEQIFKALEMQMSNIFPLNMIKPALSTIKSVKNFMTNAPAEIEDMTEGILKQNLKTATDAAKPIVKKISASQQNSENDAVSTPSKSTVDAQKLDQKWGDRIAKAISSPVKSAAENVKEIIESTPIQKVFIVASPPTDKPQQKTQINSHEQPQTVSTEKTSSSLTNVVKP